MNRGQKVANAVADWNRRVLPGDAAEVLLDDGRTMTTKTRTKALVLGGHSAVVWVDGISGCFALGRCTKKEAA